MAIDSVEGGYGFFVEAVGTYLLDATGERVRCTPDPRAGWLWRRYLLGQVLPFAALLQGLEVFHASAIEMDGGAVCFSGASGTGKSTLALNLHLAGAGFLTDDVVTVDVEDGRVVAYPGPAAVKIRRPALNLLAADRRRLGELVSSDDHELRHRIDVERGPLPIATFCVLHPDRECEEPVVEEMSGEPWALLASTFNSLVEDPTRLKRQLDVCQAIARQARILRVQLPAQPDACTADTLRATLEVAAAA